jgi:FkbM family methyltransferase
MVTSIKGHNIVIETIRSSSTILDLGANKGSFAKTLYELTGASIICVEPFKIVFDTIPQFENLIKINAAISDESTDYYLTINENSESNSLTIELPSTEKYVVVKGITIEEIIHLNNLKRLSLLKMDIEGSEIKVIRSIPMDFLKKIDQITVEFHDFIKNGPVTKKDVKQIISYLNTHGFQMIKFSPRSYMDVLFLNKTVFSTLDIFKVKTFYRFKYFIKLTFEKLLKLFR